MDSLDVADLIRSINKISQGEDKPGGFESVVMALCGGDPSDERSVTSYLHDVCKSINDLREEMESVNENLLSIAKAIRDFEYAPR